MHVGFTGTRKGMTSQQRRILAHTLQVPLWMEVSNELYFHHGDCIGADAEAARMADDLNYFIVGHPPADERFRAFFASDSNWEPRPYLERNKDIVNCGDFLVAIPETQTEKRRSGTWATIRYARERKRDTLIIYPDGSLGGWNKYGSV